MPNDDETQNPLPPRPPSPFAGRSESVFDSEGPFSLPEASSVDEPGFAFAELSSQLDAAEEPTDAPEQPDFLLEPANVHADEDSLESGEDPTSISRNSPIPASVLPMTAPALAVASADLTRTTTTQLPDRSRLWLVLLASYASAVTLALAMLLLRESKQHPLESLPDIAPEPAGKLTFVPVDAPLPDGHVLAIGDSRRFGNLLVEPLRVTREPIRYTHFTGDSGKVRDDSRPVLKLWVRFTNASQNQTFAPLDRNLLFRRVIRSSSDREYTNQYLFSPGAKTIDDVVTVFSHPATSEWDLADQKLGGSLAPGESLETYLPSSDFGLDALGEEVHWRMQVRKGLSPNSKGVTTIVDTVFHRQQIEEPVITGSSGKSTKSIALRRS